jgi:hypothetical protein
MKMASASRCDVLFVDERYLTYDDVILLDDGKLDQRIFVVFPQVRVDDEVCHRVHQPRNRSSGEKAPARSHVDLSIISDNLFLILTSGMTSDSSKKYGGESVAVSSCSATLTVVILCQFWFDVELLVPHRLTSNDPVPEPLPLVRSTTLWPIQPRRACPAPTN